MDDLTIENIKSSAAKLSHEAKGPIAVMSGILQLIEVKFPEVKGYKYWKSLYLELRNLTNLLNDFNDLNCLSSFHIEPMDLGEVLSDVVARFEPLAIHKNIQLDFELPPMAFNIIGNKDKVAEVFNNLIKNALEAITGNGKISMVVSKEEDFVLVKVADNGMGIPEDRLSCIFKPFSTYKEGGTGLGLAIVEAIVRIHRGHIQVESQVGKGTTFTVSFPC